MASWKGDRRKRLPQQTGRLVGARDVALDVLRRVEGGAFSNLALDRALETAGLNRPDRALATELVYGVLRWRLRLDYWIGQASDRPVGKLSGDLAWILRVAAYQLAFLDRVPPAAACNEAVEQAKRHGPPGSHRYVNAVCRALLRHQRPLPPPPEDWPADRRLSVTYSHPLWLVQRWLVRFGADETARMLEANQEESPITLRVNTLRSDPDQVRRLLQEQAGVEAAPGGLVPEALVVQGASAVHRLPGFEQGLFVAQDEASMLVAHAVAPQPGERVYDLCSAPGAKSTQLAQLMGDRGEVVAVDRHGPRLRLVEEGARRLGIRILRTLEADARRLPREMEGRAHRVLLDAPCSGLGVIRRRPDLRWRRTAGDLAELARLQQELLDSAAAQVAPGGLLVYSTCTLEPEETTEQIRSFLERHPEFEPAPWLVSLPSPARQALLADAGPGVPGLEERLQEDEAEGSAGGAAALDPGLRFTATLLPHRHGADGFFIARLRRRP